MSKKTFTNSRNAELLANKMFEWYGVSTTVNHYEQHSSIQIGDMEFMVSDSRLFDTNNGQFLLTYKGVPINSSQMYKLVQGLSVKS